MGAAAAWLWTAFRIGAASLVIWWAGDTIEKYLPDDTPMRVEECVRTTAEQLKIDSEDELKRLIKHCTEVHTEK